MSTDTPGSALPLPPLSLPGPTAVRSADGTRLAAYDLGGSGDDMVLVHATGFCAGVWLPLAGHLPPSRPTALDVRGHGRSATPAEGMDWHGTAADVLATVDRFGLDRPVGVGHSMGGASLVLAELERPGTFASLWLYEPIIFPPDLRAAAGDANPLADGARRRRATFDSARAAFDNYSGKPPLSALAPEALAAYVEYGFEHLEDGSVTLRCRPDTEAETYLMGSRHEAFDRLGELTCPVTVARGHDRAPGPASFAPAIATAIPGGRLEDHPELGHFGPLEAPEAMAGAISAAVTAGP